MIHGLIMLKPIKPTRELEFSKRNFTLEGPEKILLIALSKLKLQKHHVLHFPKSSEDVQQISRTSRAPLSLNKT